MRARRRSSTCSAATGCRGSTASRTRSATGDCIVHLPGAHAHTLRAGPAGLDVLVLGERRPAELCELPRTGYGWLGDSWVQVGDGDSPWERDAAEGEPDFPPPSARPDNIVNVHDVAPQQWGSGSGTVSSQRRNLGLAAGSVAVGLKHVRVDPGMLSAPPHCHSAEEEIFVVLDGDGVALIGDDETPVRGGHVISRPAGSQEAHAFRAGRRRPDAAGVRHARARRRLLVSAIAEAVLPRSRA